MQQMAGNITSDWWARQIAMYDKSINELVAVANLKPCVS
jgi:hypothetical protein